MSHLTPIVASLALIGSVLILSPAGLAEVSTFTVDSTTEAVDAKPGDGVCASGPLPNEGARCTLRAAVMEANALGGAHSIALPPGVYTRFPFGSQEDAAVTGDLDITAALTITGPTSGQAIVDGHDYDRVFDVLYGATLKLSRLTVQHGHIYSPGYGQRNIPEFGAGIQNRGTLILDSVTVRDNQVTLDNPLHSALGGGIFNQGVAVLTNVTISGNTATNRAQPLLRGFGTGIYQSGGSLTLINVTIADNKGGESLTGLQSETTLQNVLFGANEGDPASFTSYPLGPLTDNGGPALTYLPPPGSPAVNGGSANGCSDASGAPLTTDQRGFPRPQPGGGRCDLGAVEVRPPVLDLNGEAEGSSFAATFTQDSRTVPIVSTSGLTVVDPDRTTLGGATITLVHPFDGDSEVLTATTRGTAITASYASGVLTLSGTDTLAHYEQVLRTISYTNTAAQPSGLQRIIRFAVQDAPGEVGVLSSVPVMTTLTLAATSAPTSTPTATTAPTQCSPRPPVVTSTAPEDGRLRVIVSATAQTPFANALRTITWGRMDNATVTIADGGSASPGQQTALPTGAQTATFLVSRRVSNQPATVHFIVTDTCGEWPSFVGGGKDDGF